MYEKTLCYVYDLEYSPYTYDIFHILGVVEFQRLSKKLDNIHFVLLPKDDGGRANPVKVTGLSKEDVRWRELRLIVDSLYLLPSISGYSLFHTREEGLAFIQTHFQHISPVLYETITAEENTPPMEAYNHVLSNTIFHWLQSSEPFISAIQPSQVAKDYIDRWSSAQVKERKLLVLNFREAGYFSERNSSLLRWAEFCKQLDPTEYAIVVLRDFDKNMEPLPDFFPEVFTLPEVVLSQELRLALYQKAYMVLGDTAGTSVPLLHGPHVTGIFFIPDLDTTNVTQLKLMTLSLMYQNKLLFSTPKQLVVVENKKLKLNILQIFRKFERVIQNPKLQDPEYIKNFMHQKKKAILEKQVLYKLLLHILSVKGAQQPSIYFAYLLTRHIMHVLPPQQTERIQILSYALCSMFGVSPNITSGTSKDMQILFFALEAFIKGDFALARQLIFSRPDKMVSLFPYPNHWTQMLLQQNNNLIQQLPLQIKQTQTSLHLICPACSFVFKNDGDLNLVFALHHLRHLDNYLCISCLQPFQVPDHKIKYDVIDEKTYKEVQDVAFLQSVKMLVWSNIIVR